MPPSCAPFNPPPKPQRVPIEDHPSSSPLFIAVLIVGGGIVGGLGLIVVGLIWGMLPVKYGIALITGAAIILRANSNATSWLDEYTGTILGLALACAIALLTYAIGTIVETELPSTSILFLTVFSGVLIGAFFSIVIGVSIAIGLVIHHNHKTRDKK